MCGTECAKLRSMLEITYPVHNGIIQKWEDMYHLWDYTFYEIMKIKPDQCNILLTEG
jgi:actin-related protein 2